MTGQVRLRIGVIGGSGFVGSAVVARLRELQHEVRPIAAPRLRLGPDEELHDMLVSERHQAAVASLRDELQGVDGVVNAAGVADPQSTWTSELAGANALLPLVVLLSADAAGVRRFVHVSSAAVQGRGPLSSSIALSPATPYGRSKLLGESAVLAQRLAVTHPVIYRPPGVHDWQRPVTQRVAALARSRWAFVATVAPAPQATLADVARAITYLVVCAEAPPPLVHHPWSGITTSELLRVLGGRAPHRLPRPAVQAVVLITRLLGGRLAKAAALSRRLEVLALGQETAPSWLDGKPWGGRGLASWEDLARESQTRDGRFAAG